MPLFYHQENSVRWTVLKQRAANVFCKGLVKKYFRLYTSLAFVTALQHYRCSRKAAPGDEKVWLCSSKFSFIKASAAQTWPLGTGPMWVGPCFVLWVDRVVNYPPQYRCRKISITQSLSVFISFSKIMISKWMLFLLG